MTQLPYAVISAIIPAIGYVVLGFTGSTILALLTVALLLLVFIIIAGRRSKAEWQNMQVE